MASFKTVFSCDLRTLALFRICLGGLLIADLILRLRDLTAHYTDAGILPRADLIFAFGGWHPSLHLISGSAKGQALLFVGAGLVALALLLGYRTRLAAVLSWLLLASLQARNPYILQGGDLLLLMLVFWGMFLPLGARFSVDAALSPRNPGGANAYFSIGTVALLVQAMSVYFFSALLKSGPEWIPDGTAVYYALQLDSLATPFAHWLREFPLLLQALTYYVWYLELVGPLLMFSPLFYPKLRLAMQFLFITMHLGFFLNLRIGLFPFISIASLLAFTPGWVWDRLGERLKTTQRRGLRIYYDGPCEFCRKTCLLLRTFLLLPETPIRPAQTDVKIHTLLKRYNSWVVVDYDGREQWRWQAITLILRRSPIFWPLGHLFGLGVFDRLGDGVYEFVARHRGFLGRVTAILLPYRELRTEPSKLANVAVTILMAVVLAINISSLPAVDITLPKPVRDIKHTLRLSQKWDMFAPAPSKVDGWYVARGELVDGTPADIYKGIIGEPDWQRSEYLPRNYTSYRWRKYLSRLALPENLEHRPYYTNYLCAQWNGSHREEFRLAAIKVYFNARWPQPAYQPARTERLLIWKQECGVADPMDRVDKVRKRLASGADERTNSSVSRHRGSAPVREGKATTP